MLGSIKETVADLAVKVSELYKELITNSIQFQELRSSIAGLFGL
jgi:hypothetical protein